ncbi:MAG: MBL fold metallo-hydrolase [Sphingopyxis sp.]|nr:MBL fold metallo-hydrolase [Sphingopyxis sp.]
MAQRKVATGCGLVAVLLVAALVTAFAMRERIMLALFDRAIAVVMKPEAYSKDGLHILFCGTGSPLPGGDRGEACTAVIANGQLFIFDAGEGAGRSLSRMAAPLGQAQAVFLTHLHSDHINGLGNLALLRWVGSTATAPLPLLGPTGTAEVGAAFNAAYRLDAGYRTAHHGEAVAPSAATGFAPRDVAPGVVYDAGGVRITAFAVRHDPVSPAFGYRLDWDGRSVTISGDTAATAALARAAIGTDVLVAELLNPALVKRMSAAAAANGQSARAKIFADIIDYHITPAQAGQSAHAARARQLVFTHIVPAVPGFMESMLIKGASDTYSGPVKIAADKSIARSNRF